MLDEMAGLRESSERLFLSNKVDAVYFIRQEEKNEGWAYLAQTPSLTKILKNWTGSGNVQRVRGAELEEFSSVPGNTRMYLVFRFVYKELIDLLRRGDHRAVRLLQPIKEQAGTVAETADSKLSTDRNVDQRVSF